MEKNVRFFYFLYFSGILFWNVFFAQSKSQEETFLEKIFAPYETKSDLQNIDLYQVIKILLKEFNHSSLFIKEIGSFEKIKEFVDDVAAYAIELDQPLLNDVLLIKFLNKYKYGKYKELFVNHNDFVTLMKYYELVFQYHAKAVIKVENKNSNVALFSQEPLKQKIYKVELLNDEIIFTPVESIDKDIYIEEWSFLDRRTINEIDKKKDDKSKLKKVIFLNPVIRHIKDGSAGITHLKNNNVLMYGDRRFYLEKIKNDLFNEIKMNQKSSLYLAIESQQEHIIEWLKLLEELDNKFFFKEYVDVGKNNTIPFFTLSLKDIYSLNDFIIFNQDSIVIEANFPKPQDEKERKSFEKTLFSLIKEKISINKKIYLSYLADDNNNESLKENYKKNIYFGNLGVLLDSENLSFDHADNFCFGEPSSSETLNRESSYTLHKFLKENYKKFMNEFESLLDEKNTTSSDVMIDILIEFVENIRQKFFIDSIVSQKKSVILEKLYIDNFIKDLGDKCTQKIKSANLRQEENDVYLKKINTIIDEFSRQSFFNFFASIEQIPYKNVVVIGYDKKDFKTLFLSNQKYKGVLLTARDFWQSLVHKKKRKENNFAIPPFLLQYNLDSSTNNFDKISTREILPTILALLNTTQTRHLREFYSLKLYSEGLHFDIDSLSQEEKRETFIEKKGELFDFCNQLFAPVIENTDDIKKVIDLINAMYVKNKKFLDFYGSDQKAKLYHVIYAMLFNSDKSSLDSYFQKKYDDIFRKISNIKSFSDSDFSKSIPEKLRSKVEDGGILVRKILAKKKDDVVCAIPIELREWLKEVEMSILKYKEDEKEGKDSLVNIKKAILGCPSLCGAAGAGKTRGYELAFYYTDFLLNKYNLKDKFSYNVFSMGKLMDSYVNGALGLMADVSAYMESVTASISSQNRVPITIFFIDEFESLFQSEKNKGGDSSSQSQAQMRAGMKDVITKYDIGFVMTSNQNKEKVIEVLDVPLYDRIKNYAKLHEIKHISGESLLFFLNKKEPSILWDEYDNTIHLWAQFNSDALVGGRGMQSEIIEIVSWLKANNIPSYLIDSFLQYKMRTKSYENKEMKYQNFLFQDNNERLKSEDKNLSNMIASTGAKVIPYIGPVLEMGAQELEMENSWKYGMAAVSSAVTGMLFMNGIKNLFNWKPTFFLKKNAEESAIEPYFCHLGLLFSTEKDKTKLSGYFNRENAKNLLFGTAALTAVSTLTVSYENGEWTLSNPLAEFCSKLFNKKSINKPYLAYSIKNTAMNRNILQKNEINYPNLDSYISFMNYSNSNVYFNMSAYSNRKSNHLLQDMSKCNFNFPVEIKSYVPHVTQAIGEKELQYLYELGEVIVKTDRYPNLFKILKEIPNGNKELSRKNLLSIIAVVLPPDYTDKKIVNENLLSEIDSSLNIGEFLKQIKNLRNIQERSLYSDDIQLEKDNFNIALEIKKNLESEIQKVVWTKYSNIESDFPLYFFGYFNNKKYDQKTKISENEISRKDNVTYQLIEKAKLWRELVDDQSINEKEIKKKLIKVKEKNVANDDDKENKQDKDEVDSFINLVNFFSK